MMIKIVIVDDEKMILNHVHQLVMDICNKQKIESTVKTYDRGKDLLYDIEEGCHFDIFILDIEMPEISGIELAKKIKQSREETYIIFLTSYIEYAVDGYELEVSRFIPKTLMEKKLPKAILDIYSKIRDVQDDFYIINTSFRYEKICLKDIQYLYKDRKNTVFVTVYGESKVRKTIKMVCEEINSDDFIMIDRGIVVNISCIMKIEGNKIFLKDGSTLFISRSHLRSVKFKINYFWGIAEDEPRGAAN